jgi:serine/threonine-protein kinase
METIGRYLIQTELGRGAMGVVYRAQDPAIGRWVAIKTIKLAELSDEVERGRLRDRLFREAQSAGILSHPGIVVVYDVGEDGEVTYIAMEFVGGPTLEKLLEADEPPDQQTILDVLRQTAAALDYAHKKGIVHRDIKPANIMIAEDGTVKITDFGVAKISASQQLTQAGMVLGTPNYMSPEQIQGKPVDGRADQFALAVVSYEMLTGEKPFQGEQLTTVLYKIVSEEPPAPQRLNPTLGFAVDMVLGRALAKDAAKRYPTCTEFIAALEAALNTKKGWKALPRGVSANLPTAMVHKGRMTARPAAYAEAERLAPKRTKAWHVIAAALAGLGAVALLFVAAQRYFLPAPEGTGAAETAGPAARQPGSSAEPAARPAPPPSPAQPEAAKTEPQATPAPQPPAPAPAQAEPPPVPTPKQVEPPKARPPEPPPAREQPLQVVTNPPGAAAVLDDDLSRTCTTPCSFQVGPGRHTLAVTLAGYRRELRIVEVTSPKELFINLTQPTGTLRVESDPPGARILINGELRAESTPTTFTLPAGKYVLTVSKDGRRAEQAVEVKDGSLSRLDLQLNP